jgi:hypothetical protein
MANMIIDVFSVINQPPMFVLFNVYSLNKYY